VLTALLLIPLALVPLLVGGWVFAAVVAVMAVFLVFEWTRLVRGAELQRGFYVLSATALAAIAAAASGLYLLAVGVMIGGGVLATLVEWPSRNPDSWPAVGAGYLIGPAIAALYVREVPEEGLVLTLMLFAVVWGADSGAYAFGKSIGGPKLIPKVSPGKTWAGAIGGALTGGVVAGLVAWIGGLEGPLGWALFGVVLAAVAMVGDIAESQLKRSYGVKDSGSAFPGHGGALDRLDGFLFAAVAMAALVLFRGL
jgi:phosphatidate cytidylyltransferase